MRRCRLGTERGRHFTSFLLSFFLNGFLLAASGGPIGLRPISMALFEYNFGGAASSAENVSMRRAFDAYHADASVPAMDERLK